MGVMAVSEINHEFSNWIEKALPAHDKHGEPNFQTAEGELKEGIYLDMPNSIYHALPAYSSSHIKTFMNSPAAYYREYLSDITRARSLQLKRALDTGTLSHELLLEPDDFYKKYFRDLIAADLPDAIHSADELAKAMEKAGLPAKEGKREKLERLYRLVPEAKGKTFKTVAEIDAELVANGLSKTETKRDKAHRLTQVVPDAKVFDYLQQENRLKHGKAETIINEHGDKVNTYGGKLPIDGLVWDDAFRARQTVLEHVDARGHLSYGVPEVTFIARCPGTGLMLKAKFDWLRFDDNAVDVKTTQSAEPEMFRRKLYALNYHIQDQFYCYVSQLLGVNIGTFTFVAVEFSQCSVCQPYQISPTGRKYARIKLMEGLTEFKWCLENDTWYGYVREDCTIILD